MREERAAWSHGGWRPRRRRARALETTDDEVEDSEPAFAVGARVFHQKFGYGRIAAVDGDKLDIAFEKAGNKKVIASFVRPA